MRFFALGPYLDRNQGSLPCIDHSEFDYKEDRLRRLLIALDSVAERGCPATLGIIQSVQTKCKFIFINDFDPICVFRPDSEVTRNRYQQTG